jgi:hypothetical protein
MAEAADVSMKQGQFAATGVKLGVGPVPYRVDYVLDTTAAWVTRTLQITAQPLSQAGP